MSCGDKENSNKNAYQRAEREYADNMRAEGCFSTPPAQTVGYIHVHITLSLSRSCVAAFRYVSVSVRVFRSEDLDNVFLLPVPSC